MLPRTLRTARLTLRPWRFEDLPDVLGYATDPEWGRFLPLPEPYTEDSAREFLAAQVLLDPVLHPSWALERDGHVVGGINLRFFDGQRVGEFGYSLARTHWNQGLTTEAARRLIDAAFDRVPQLQRVRAMADARNLASIRVFEKLGLLREGVLRQNRVVRGAPIDETWYGLLRREWKPPVEDDLTP